MLTQLMGSSSFGVYLPGIPGITNRRCDLWSSMAACFYQISSRFHPLKKGTDLGVVFEGVDTTIHLVKSEDDCTSKTQMAFGPEMTLWNSGGVCMTKTRLYISDINSLRSEGVYCYLLKAWKRCYVTREGVCISIIEDVPESGGQFCLWTAGLVLTNFLEYDDNMRRSLRGKKFLEIGSGAGLTSMVASILGANVVCTEQESCLSYLKTNIELNPDVDNIEAKCLGWVEGCDDGDGDFDIVVGCDITYDPKMFKSIVKVFKKYMSLSGIGLICHDNDSCPLSKFAHTNLERICEDEGFCLKEIDYSSSVQPGFFNSNVHLWSLKPKVMERKANKGA